MQTITVINNIPGVTLTYLGSGIFSILNENNFPLAIEVDGFYHPEGHKMNAFLVERLLANQALRSDSTWYKTISSNENRFCQFIDEDSIPTILTFSAEEEESDYDDYSYERRNQSNDIKFNGDEQLY